MELTIKNGKDLDTWLNNCRLNGHDLYSVKGTAPDGSTYSDGGLILNKVNIAWKNSVTNEVFFIEY